MTTTTITAISHDIHNIRLFHAHQASFEHAACRLNHNTPRNTQIAIEPRMPQTASVELHADLLVATGISPRHRFELLCVRATWRSSSTVCELW